MNIHSKIGKDYYLIAKDLSKTYKQKKDRKALDGLYLSIKKGEVLGLLGPNGAGKTTLLKILTNMETTDTGVAYIKGVDATSDKTGRKHFKVGFCPQFDILWPSLSIQDHMKFFYLLKNAQNSQISSDLLLQKLSLYTDRHKLVSELSGGMKRRLTIGIA